MNTGVSWKRCGYLTAIRFMKRIKLNVIKLQLEKERVINLSNQTMGIILGGGDISRGGDACNTMHLDPGGPIPQPMSVAKYGLWTCLQLTHSPSGGDRQYCN